MAEYIVREDLYEPDALRNIGKDDLVYLGLDTFAYIRRQEDSTGATFSLSSADGTELGVFENQAVAIAFARQHDLDPLFAH